MSLVPTIYSSSDPGAPALSGQSGALTTVLDAILVNGYGAGPSAKAGSGWTMELTSSNKRVYRCDPVEGSGYYLRIDDTTAAGNARFAYVSGHEEMIDIDTGVNSSPANEVWVKSATVDAVERGWWAIATSTYVYLFIEINGVKDRAVPNFAGDILSIKPADRHAFMVSNGPGDTWAGNVTVVLSGLFWNQKNAGTGADIAPISACGYIARNHLGAVGWSRVVHITQDVPFMYPYPDLVGGGLLLRPASLQGGALNVMRGYLPGVYRACHVKPLLNEEIYPGVPALGGASAVVKNAQPAQLQSTTAGVQLLFHLGAPPE